MLTDYRYDNPNPIPLFYQTGYLTITGYDEKSYDPLDIRSFGMDIEAGDTDSIRDRFTALFARLPYPDDERIIEQNFQNVVYIVFMLLGQYTMTEIHSAKGRADCIVETEDFVYIFEFKRDKSADEALAQIEDTGYAKPYAADKRTLFKIGVSFNSKDRIIDEWKVMK